ncbi:Dynein assembly factor 1, axonemal [Terramyces sp. JEL0728]|nr:Dynein assembly factor 1, axonemal [Terramyces sp. JEL0728]
MLSNINLDAKSWLARRRNAKEVDEKGNTLMTLAYLKQLCKEQKVYQTPELNDILYLHFKGFSRIENLDLYTGLKSLWLEGNGISKIENIEMLSELRCLFLQQNCIEAIENLEKLEKLDTLNVGNNLVKKIQGLESLKYLKTLQIQSNFLISYEDLAGLLDCPSITVLDLGNNKIEDPEIVSILEQMPNLAVLNLMGNPVIRKITNYRRIMVSKIKTLTYLDDRPIFDKERLTTDAWAVGGMEGERLERERIYEEEKKKQEANFEAMRILQENGRKKRLEKYGEEKEPALSEKMQEFKDEMLARIEQRVSPDHNDKQDLNGTASNPDAQAHDDLLEEVYEAQPTPKIEQHHVPPRNMVIQEKSESSATLIEEKVYRNDLDEKVETETKVLEKVKQEPRKALIEEIYPEKKLIITDEDIKEANALQYQLDAEQSVPAILINGSHLPEDIKYSIPPEQSKAEKELLFELVTEGKVSQESLLNLEEKLVVKAMLDECWAEEAGAHKAVVQEVEDEIEVITTDGFSKQSTMVELDERKKAW